MSYVRWLALSAVPVLVLACGGGGGGGGGGPTAPGPAPRVVTVEIRDNEYSPRSVTIQPGDTVRWVLRGVAGDHTVTARDGSFNSGAVFTSSGAIYERRFDQARSTFEYSCQAHRDCCQMQGSVRVGSDAPEPLPGY